MNRPNEEITNFSWNIKNELEQLRKELIETFFQAAITYTDIIIKRKLGILTSDICDYYRFKKKSNLISTEEFYLLPKIQYDNEENLTDLLNGLQHICVTCPLNFISIDDTKLTSSSWSRVYMCDICHCTRALEDNMIRHLESELHLSATEYRTDSATMILNHCIRRSCIQMNRYDKNTFDSIIVCPICYEPFSNVNSCAIHSHLSHNMDYIYSIASIFQTFDLIIKQDDICMECNEQFKTLSLLVKHLNESNHGPHETDKLISLFLCRINKCYYRTKHFFNFKTHLISIHNNSFNSIDRTIKVKIKQFIKPYTYMHITRFLHKNQSDINEELKAFEQLEYDVKYLSDNTNILKIIKKRYDLLKNL
ncbi:unnamed protein product [Rotaria sordida]|uniref:C2H2-type domain-containing protein n=1 Tax=Rotaria sordida TaxID=392033 RepID=A0A818MB82_9BILA|nr:unnamed protein product [Rotaria sordida]CAF3582950.1 unnamed protein product [Rotaria sordida]